MRSEELKNLITEIALLDPLEDFSDSEEERPSVVTLEIPVEPLAVQSVRVSRFGLYQPASVKQWKKDVALHAKRQFPWKPYEGPLKVRFVEYAFKVNKTFPKKILKRIEAGETFYMDRRGDLMDNLNKATFDALAGIIFTDDKNIVECGGMRKIYSMEPHISITFENLEGKVNIP